MNQEYLASDSLNIGTRRLPQVVSARTRTRAGFLTIGKMVAPALVVVMVLLLLDQLGMDLAKFIS